MANPRNLRFEYQAKSNTTGLTDVFAQVYLNNVAKAVGVGAILLTEVDATNSPGLYELFIPSATLVTWGVAAGSENTVSGYINSATKPAYAPFKQQVTFYTTDEVMSRIGTPAGASVSADIASIKSDTSAIKTDLESGPNSLATILTAIQAVQNNAGFAVPVPAQLIIPGSGSNVYRIPVTVYDTNNDLVDPDSNTITVALVNQAGTNRASYLSSTTMTRDSLGQYHVDVTILSSAPQEELLFTFSYDILTKTTARRAVTETMPDVAASGFALQSTLLDVQGDVDNIESVVTDAGFGNAAIKAAVVALQTDVTNNVEGSGFSASTDSLHAISAYLITNLFIGGRAV